METLHMITHSLGWAILHSIWQGLLLFLLLKLVLRTIPDRYSSARYYTAVGFLMTQVAWFFVNFFSRLSFSVTIPIATSSKTVGNTVNQTVPASSSFVPDSLSQITIWFNEHTQLISTVYLLGMMLLLIRLTYNIVQTNNLRTIGTTPVTRDWQSNIDRCIERLRISKNVRVYFSNKVHTPVTMGSLKPVILIPIAIVNQLSTAEAEAILLHELAHIKRNDFLLNIFQMLVETIMFYNPFVWLISSIIRTEREHCCDDIVVQTTDQKMPYAKALASIETYRQAPEHIAMAATGNKNYLLNRIKRIMEMKKTNINQSQLISVSFVVLLTIASVVFLSSNIYAQKKDGDKDKKKKEKTVIIKEERIVIEDDNGNKKVYTSLDDIPKKEREKLEKAFEGSDATILVGPKKKVLVRAYSTDEMNKDADNNNVNIDIDLTEEAIISATKVAKEAINAASEALEEIDITQLIDSALESIDWDEVKQEIREAQATSKQAANEANKSIVITKKVRSEHVQEAHKELEEAREELALARRELAEARRELSEVHHRSGTTIDLGSAGKAMHKGLMEYSNRHKEMLASMENDGLINKKKGYTIEKKGRKLYIDGIKQSEEVYKKYEPMMDAKDMKIRYKKNSISIDVTD